MFYSQSSLNNNNNNKLAEVLEGNRTVNPIKKTQFDLMVIYLIYSFKEDTEKDYDDEDKYKEESTVIETKKKKID